MATNTAPKSAKANRAWWKLLPEGARTKLLEAIGREDADVDAADAKAASDEDIARCLDVDDFRLDEDDGTFSDKDLPLFLRLTNLEHLGFYGDPDSIEPLRTLPRLTRLTINNDVIKAFAWPSRADRDLWKAAEAADRNGIEKALAAGASLHARGDHGATALTMVAQSHDIELCQLLIARGADPWAGDHGESNAFYFYDDNGKQALEAAAAKAGIPHPENDPYRVFLIERMPKCATFEKPDMDLELDDGESIAARWPPDVRVQMEPPKKDDKLYDVLRVMYDNAIVSEKVAAVLRGEKNVELLPVTVVDHSGKAGPEPYYLVNPLALDCLDIAKCHPQWNHIDTDSATEVAALIIDPAKAGAATIFRPTILNSRPTIVSRALAEKLKRFAGARIEYLKR